MKKLLLPCILLLALILSACGNTSDKKDDSSGKNDDQKTITYQSENGPVKVPAHPKRVVVLSSFTGNLLQLGVNVVGVDSWSKNNPFYKDQLKNVPVVSEDNLEKIIELNPDLIIGLSTTKNIDKLKKIAPTITFTWGKVDYLTQHIEIGKLVNKEKEARTWVDDFKKRAEAAGNDIRAKIGQDATVTVIETYDKDLYVFGDDFGRGTEILYQAMKLKMPDKVKEVAEKSGYYTISPEVLPQYVGDYLFVSKYSNANTAFQDTNTYKNMPAVKNQHVFEMDGNGSSFSDPITLDGQLEFFKKSFLGTK